MFKAGPDTDALIARKLMGLRLVVIHEKRQGYTSNGPRWFTSGTYVEVINANQTRPFWYRIPSYSSHPDAAHLVIERMYKKGFNFECRTAIGWERRDYPLFRVKFFSDSDGRSAFWRESSSFAEAVCDAALCVI